jgi:hypothetical protein
MVIQPFYAKGLHHLQLAGSRAARGKITSGIATCLNYCVIFIVYIYIYIYNLQTLPWAAYYNTAGRRFETHDLRGINIKSS